jgi:acyl-CoA synthetase (AMP-forming)/AMP-acid ligase II
MSTACTIRPSDAQSKLVLVPETSNGVKSGPSTNIEKAAAALNIPVVAVSFDLASGKVTLAPRDELAKQKAAGATTSSMLPTISGSDEALFLHTSGTTSRPKGVPLTHGNLAASIKNISATYEMTPEDRTIIVMPLFHVHGLMAALLSTLSAGGTVVLPAGGKFSATTFWDDVVANGITWYTAVPTIHQILLSRKKSGADDAKLKEMPKLKFIRSCSAALAPSILQDLEDAFKAPVLEAYASEDITGLRRRFWTLSKTFPLPSQ